MERTRAILVAVAVLVVAIAVAVSTASAHIERASYWPDPAPDTSVKPAAGGKVPAARGLFKALRTKPAGKTRVVCQGRSSMRRLRRSVRSARANGWAVRPMAPRRALKPARARRLLKFNKRLLAKCKFRSIQTAVTRSRNNDRVVVMPGLYTEPRSRNAPTNDPKCAHLKTRNDEGSAEALSYAYQVECPNDQNLIAVLGRHHASGRCIRCNVQIEGTGRRPGDVLIDAGRHRKLRGKDVAIRGDRADGLHVRNLRAVGAGEHAVYFIETDGYMIRRVHADRNGNYGFLTFASDHGLTNGCEASWNNNAGVYPGGAPDTFPRFNQRITNCDLHDNVLGYSGTMGNSVLFEDNHVYRNTVGINMDSYLAAGHPGYPQDHSVFRRNRIHSNNLNPYVKGSKLRPSFPFPVGTGIHILGGNGNLVAQNWIYDNWRRGVMLSSVPGFITQPPQPHPDPTSHENVQRRNRMGVSPSGRRLANGVDFWWDEEGRRNCWEDNGAAVTSDPSQLDRCPGRPIAPPAVGDPEKQAVLASCATWPEETSQACDWFDTPPRPGAAGSVSATSARSTGNRGTLVPMCPPLGPFSCVPTRPVTGAVTARDSCARWSRASERSRRASVTAMRLKLAADVQYSGARIVPARVAHAHISAACAQPVAEGFSIWMIFTAHSTWYAGRTG
jgi:Right handed beta helix region